MNEIYDFTIDFDAMDPVTRQLFFRLRRVAILAGDASLLPNGRTMTRAEVLAQLGETGDEPMAAPAENAQCCN